LASLFPHPVQIHLVVYQILPFILTIAFKLASLPGSVA
jgi:hypothetical protein